MSEQTPGPDDVSGEVDDRARSVELPTEGGEQVIAQQNMGADEATGSGEWPSPGAAPTGPAPGTAPEEAEAASRREQAPPRPPPPGSASQDDRQQDGRTGGDAGPARAADLGTDGEGEAGTDESFNRVLDSDPVAGGSQAVPRDEDPVDPSPG